MEFMREFPDNAACLVLHVAAPLVLRLAASPERPQRVLAMGYMRGIAGTYHSVSSRWLQSYLNEYAWRYCHRHEGERSMFESLLIKAAD